MPKPIRVLHVVISLDPGGLENGIVNVASRLDGGLFDIRVCGLERRGKYAQRMPDPKKVFTLNKPPGKSPATLWRLICAIRDFRPHVVHSHNLGPLLYAAPAVRLAACGTRLLQGEHGQLVDADLQPRRLKLRHFFYHACHQVHTVSSALRDHLIDLGFPSKKIMVLLNGVDSERFSPGSGEEIQTRFGLTPDTICIGIVGRLSKRKGHALLIRAIAKLNAPQLRLLIIGDGPERENLAKLTAELKREKQVIFAGYQTQMPPFYRAMNLMVLPSSQEGLSNAILESMACGVPVLTAGACGNHEVIQDKQNGWIAPMSTAAEIADSLAALLQAPDKWLQAGKQARQTVQNRFSMDAMAAAYAAIYRKLAKED